MAERTQNIHYCLAELEQLFRRWTRLDLFWTKIILIEQDRITVEDGKRVVSSSALIDVEHYSERFEQLMQLGYSWLNMNAAGILDDALIVIIELPRYAVDSGGRTSINFSGPNIIDGKPQWDLGGRFVIGL